MSTEASGRSWVSRAAAAAFLAVGVAVFAGAFGIGEGGGYQAVGPRAFPLLAGGALTLVAIIAVVQAFRTPTPAAPGGDGGGGAARGGDTAPAAGGDGVAHAARTEWRPVLGVLGVLAAYVAVLVPLGYWQATTVLFTLVARILGSRRLVRDAGIGLALALATYILFDRVLGIELPPGIVRLAI